MVFKDVLVALLSLLDVASGAILALSFGFFLMPSAFGFLVGGIGSLLTGSVTPVSFQQENLVLAKNMGKDMRSRISMILGAAILTAVIGIFGLPQIIVDTVGQEIFLGMLAGVGIYLAKVGFDLAFEDIIIGLPCLVVALVVQLWKNDLVWAVTASVVLGIIIKLIKDKVTKTPSNPVNVPHYKSYKEAFQTEFKLIKPIFNKQVLIGVLAIATLTLGGNIAYTGVNLSMSGTAPTYNQVTVISGLADLASSIFGGASMEVIISATAAAPHAVISGAILMFGAAIILLTGLVHKIAKFVPLAGMGGYLVAIGAILVLPPNAADAFNAGNPVVVGLTLVTTAVTNPFYGLIVGVLAKLVMGWMGVL
ncbi:MAG: NCS2 family permease [Chloroflexi bacterium]|nr:NCS2 family permease [Chloroflexota bacterium]